MSTRQLRIETVLTEALDPMVLEIENESHMHSGQRTESHFKVLIVSQAFEGRSRLDRQRLVNELLKEELQTGLHALMQKTLTPSEWETQKDVAQTFISPECRGGSKRKPN